GTAADIAAACARTAMASGARALASWLADLDRRPSSAEIPWQSDATSVSVPGGNTPPPRPSRTASLANIPQPHGDFGEGTPGFKRQQTESIEEPLELVTDRGIEKTTTPARPSQLRARTDPSELYKRAERIATAPPDITKTTPHPAFERDGTTA